MTSNRRAQSRETPTSDKLIELATDLVSAFLSFNRAPSSEISPMLLAIFNSLRELAGLSDPEPTPAVPIKKSISDDFIVCLEDGKKLRTLKRYLMSHFGMTTEDYRKKWHLPADYPMVAPSYAVLRSEFAKKSGLGRKRGGRRKKPM